jgi:ribosomal protein L32
MAMHFSIAGPYNTVNNIELLYLYITDFKNLKNIGLNFSGNHRYTLTKTDNEQVLSCTQNHKYPESLFPILMHAQMQETNDKEFLARELSHVTAIIGQNGAGKSNVLDYLKRILSNNLSINEESLVIVKIDGVVTAYHSFTETVKLDASCKIAIRRSVKRLSASELSGEESDKSYERLHVSCFDNTKAVYYSSHADLQSFPSNFDDPPYNDISTNYLFEYDFGKGEQFAKSDFNKILSHKSQTIRRFIDLIYSNLPLPKDIRSFIPKNTFIQINRLSGAEHQSRNLDYKDKDFIERFYKKLQGGWNAADKLKKNGEQLASSRLLAKTELAYSIINHFFHNKEDVYGANSQINAEDIDWELPLEGIVEFYFKNQKWKNAATSILVYDSLNEAINIAEEFSGSAGNSVSFKVDGTTDLVSLYSNYLTYEQFFFDTGNPAGLLDFYWRGISSGEKTLLDLFARLLHTKREDFKNAGASIEREKKKYTTVFL